MRDALESIITKYRQQFTIRQLENDIMSHYGSIEQYEKAGRYPAFYRAVRELQKDGEIHPIRSSKEHNGMNPTLEMKWRKKSKEKIQRWTDSMFIEAARTGLDLSVHKRHPVLQTDKEWEWIIKVMNFLQQPCPNDVSKEERSYELFGYEKLLDDGEEGEKFIKRVGLNLNDLRAISYGEPFVFWRNPASSLQKDALIVENLSAFHTAKRAISTYGSLYGMKIDLLIYGEGTHFDDFLKENGLKDYLTTDLKTQVNSDSFFLSSKAVKNILLYVLLMMFLSGSVENFISEYEAFCIPIPFGNGPWICNNPVCEGYNLGVIKKCVRVDHDGRYISGLFGCPLCGFSFSRRWTLNDNSNEKPYAVLTMGPLWHSTVWELHSSGLSNNAIAKRLKTTPTQIKRSLNRISEPASDTRILQSLEMLWASSMDNNGEVAATSEGNLLLTENRERILGILQNHNGISRTELAKRYNHLYSKMLKNDRDWMEQNLPPSKKNQIRKDWAKLDQEYSKVLAAAVDDLYRLNPAEQIKRYTILAHSPKIITEHFENAPEKFPKVMELLKSKVESDANYLIRHLPVIIEQMKKHNKRVISLDSIKTFSPMYRRSIAEVDERIINQLETMTI